MPRPSINTITPGAAIGATVQVFGFNFSTVTSAAMEFDDDLGNPITTVPLTFTIVSNFEMSVTMPPTVPGGAVVFESAFVQGGTLRLVNPSGASTGIAVILGTPGPWVTPDPQADATGVVSSAAAAHGGSFWTDASDFAGPAYELVSAGFNPVALNSEWALLFGDAINDLAQIATGGRSNPLFGLTIPSAASTIAVLSALLAYPGPPADPVADNFPAYGVAEVLRLFDLGRTMFNMAGGFSPPSSPDPTIIGYEIDVDDVPVADRLVGPVTISLSLRGWAQTNGQAGLASTSEDFAVSYIDPAAWDPGGVGYPFLTTGIPGSTLATEVPLGDATVAGGSSSFPVTVAVPNATLDTSQLGSVAFPDDWMSIRPGPAVILAIFPERMLTDAAPSLPPTSGSNPWGNLDAVAAIHLTPIWTLTWQPPRYRPLRAGSHQRNFPRDDGLGISTARSFPPQVDSIRSYPKIP